MSTPYQRKLKKFNIAEIDLMLAELEISEALRKQADQQKSELAIINLFMETGNMDAAIRFLALGLPKRESIWWAHICAELHEGNQNNLKTQQALRNSEAWVMAPNENHRQTAKVLADTLELYTPASWVNMAIFWESGSIAPPDKPAVYAPFFMSGHACANAIIMAADASEEHLTCKKRFLKRGLHIAMGGNGKIDC